MATYEEIMTTGDNAPDNVIAGDLNSILIRVLNREDLKDLTHPVGPMPPTKALPPEVIDIFTRWVAGGAPNTAADAANLKPATSPPAAVTTPTQQVSPAITTPAPSGTP